MVTENTAAIRGFEHHTFICSGCHIRVRRIVFTRQSAHSLGLQFHVLNAGTDQDIDTLFAGLIQQRIGVLLVSADPFFLQLTPEQQSFRRHLCSSLYAAISVRRLQMGAHMLPRLFR